MIRALAFLFLLPFIVVSPVAGDDGVKDAKAPQWSLRGFTVVRAGEPEEEDVFDSRARAAVGTSVTARLHIPTRYLIGFDLKQSKLESFTDDKNTDLLLPPAKPPRRVSVRESQPVSGSAFTTDGKYARFNFHAPSGPRPGAAKVRVKGIVAVVVGKGEKEADLKDFSLKDGVALPVGTLKLVTRNAGIGSFGSTNSMVTFKGTSALKSATFLDGEGKEIPVRRGISLTFSDPTRRDFETYFSITGRNQFEPCKRIRATYFEQPETILVPIDLEVGPGL